jgi:hypothetical protein
VETMRKPLSSKKDDEQTTLGDISWENTQLFNALSAIRAWGRSLAIQPNALAER